jgi:purine-nucleoside phosphorylase
MAPLSNSELEALPKDFVEALNAIKSRLPAHLAVPKWGVVCGSGLSGLVDHIEEQVLINYDTIPVSRASILIGLSLT